MFLGTQDNPFLKATLLSVYMWKHTPCRLSQSWLCIIIHNPCWIIKCVNIPLSFRFPRSFDHSRFCQINFHFSDVNSALSPKCRHYMTLATPGVVLSRWAKAFIWRKFVPLAGVALPAEARQLTHLSCLAPYEGNQRQG